MTVATPRGANKDNAPVANASSGETDEDQSTSITLSGSDIDGDDLPFSLDTDASNGSVSIDGNIATYTPLADYNGSDSFIFIISDGDLTDTQVLSVTVNPVNDAPIADDTFSQTDEDISVDIALVGSDIDSNDLTYLLDQDSSDGFVQITGSIANFTPDENFNGSTTFTYRVTDGELTSNTATVIIDVPL